MLYAYCDDDLWLNTMQSVRITTYNNIHSNIMNSSGE